MGEAGPLFEIQYLKPETTVIGLTGPLSAGCSTIAEYLEREKGYTLKRLSDIIRKELREKDGIESPEPRQLQDKGDELRGTHGHDTLVRSVFKDLFEKKPERIVIDGIRNPGEIKYLRKFSGFFLIGIDASREERLRRYRIKTGSPIPDQDFFGIDERDSGKNQQENGQNVTRCIDLTDYQIINQEAWDDDLTVKEKLFKKVELLLDLIKEPGSVLPSMQQIGMHLAYSASLMSPCLKRQVGAMIAREVESDKELAVAIGYNRPPDGVKNCFDRFHGCYRDLLKDRMENKLSEEQEKLTTGLNILLEEKKELSTQLNNRIGESFGNLKKSFLSDPELKQLDYCQAIHAEESAILQVAKLGGVSLGGTTLYTTTFPCIMCAKKIIQTGISKVVYNEAYPVIQAKELLSRALGAENLIRFEGVKALAFFKLFQSNRI